MNQYQFRAIRNSYHRDEIYSKGTGYNNDLLEYPIMRKKIDDIKICRKRKIEKDCYYVLTKKNNVYKFWWIDYGHTGRTLFVITLNDVIIYWTTSSISLPAWDSWHILTDTYHGMNDHSSWRWRSVDDFEAEDVSMTRHLQEGKHLNIYRKETIDGFKKTGKYLIDKEIISSEKRDTILKTLYYHL